MSNATPNRFMQSLAVLEDNEAQAAVAPLPTTATGPAVPLLAEIVTKMPPKKNRGVSQTFYVSKEVLQAMEREAKRRGMVKSNLVDEVLRRVLLAIV